VSAWAVHAMSGDVPACLALDLDPFAGRAGESRSPAYLCQPFRDGGGNVLVLQKILGHTSLTMTLRYSHLSPDHLEEAVALNPFDTAGRQKRQSPVERGFERFNMAVRETANRLSTQRHRKTLKPSQDLDSTGSAAYYRPPSATDTQPRATVEGMGQSMGRRGMGQGMGQAPEGQQWAS